MELYQYTAHELRDLLTSRQVSALDVVDSVLARIDEVEDQVHAYITVASHPARDRAQQIDAQRAAGAGLPPLAGIPVAVKDNLCTAGLPTTCASRMLAERHVPIYDATVVARLQTAGAIILGKTNMDEFAMGSSTENSAFFPTRNPWHLDRVPGGTSGGSAAALAAGETILALGSDTGGSIRQPGSFCGVVGLKPTYGRVSRYGLVAYASSLDQVGPLARDVTDAALLLAVLSGHDPRDSTSVDAPVPDYSRSLRADVQGLRLGRPREYFGQAPGAARGAGLDPEVRAPVERAIEQLAGWGAEVVDVSLPHTEYAVAAFYLIAMAEASSNLARYDGLRYGYRAGDDGVALHELIARTRGQGFGAEVKRRIMLGTYALSAGYYDAYYDQAQRVRTLIKHDYDCAFELCDLLVSPVSPFPAFALGEKVADPLQMYLADVYTVTANLAGIPALSVPCGFSDAGLPVGLQLQGPLFSEELLLRVAYTFEQNTDHHRRRPPLGRRT
ncbi:MAG: Asp-tRNA(Asn)/Glu-tRNA(Gln) amidotransferase subunit GatA [Anaerolineae bacterium]|nr:Asp-tRNA(Asn)/Glu-tRNA(Gln) amidotransferase subunit GatA [Anaerolineae bacterium]